MQKDASPSTKIWDDTMKGKSVSKNCYRQCTAAKNTKPLQRTMQEFIFRKLEKLILQIGIWLMSEKLTDKSRSNLLNFCQNLSHNSVLCEFFIGAFHIVRRHFLNFLPPFSLTIHSHFKNKKLWTNSSRDFNSVLDTINQY